MSGPARVVVRRARPADAAQRLRLLADVHAETQFETFLYFFFQELTLQCVVLSGAVLFIFCGVSVFGCLLVLPSAAVIVWLSVWLHTLNTVNNLNQMLREEADGWVAVSCGPLMFGSPGNTLLEVVEEDDDKQEYAHREVVGTVSLCPERGYTAGCGAAGWLRGLGVARPWRRRGAARALAGAMRLYAVRGGYTALHATTSHLQPQARALLHALGWECRGTYHRPLLGEALTLPMAHLVQDLPHA